MSRVSTLSLLMTATVLLGGCSQEPAAPAPPAVTAAPTLPAGLLLTAAPAGAPIGVGAAKEGAKDGDTILVRGRIGGTVPPFVGQRAIMTIADTDNITDCRTREGDGCPTPWDYCCDDPKDIQANIATVLVRNAAGDLLKVDLEGVGGLVPLAVVVVEGRATRPDGETLEIIAQHIYVEP